MKDFFQKNDENNEIKNEIDDIKKNGKKKSKDWKYETKQCICDFQQYETIRSSGDNTYIHKVNVDEAEMDQSIY